MGIFRQGRRWLIVTGVVVGVGLAGGCSDDSGSKKPASGGTEKPAPSKPEPAKPTEPTEPEPAKPKEPAVETRSTEEVVQAGRAAYLSNCIACHNLNHALDGSLGPAVAGASLELLHARVVRGDYPEGYTPKRPTRVMIPLPHLEPKLPELAAYLDSVE